MSDDELSDGADGAEPGRGSEAPIADDRAHRLDPRSVEVERLGSGLGVGCATLPVMGVLVVVLFQAPSTALRLLAVIAALGIVAGLAVLAWAWPGIAYRHRWYRLDDEGLEIQRGVVWRQTVFVPRSRVQHTDVNQGPIERHYGLAHLVIHTAGTQGASVGLSGLAHGTAVRIRDHLVHGGPGDAV